ncbi:MAG: tryptophan--tRNA ligase, partial [Bacilli bacterium]|nr:tryptophan--tRNA ligase [Bacilli bacterium]
GNAIYLKDDEETITKKIMGAVTDPNKIKKDDKANPDICMVYYYHKLIENKNIETVCKECKNGERGCVACKKELINNMLEFLKPIHEKRQYYLEHQDEVKKVLEKGNSVAQKKAKETMAEIKKSMQINY